MGKCKQVKCGRTNSDTCCYDCNSFPDCLSGIFCEQCKLGKSKESCPYYENNGSDENRLKHEDRRE